MDAERLHVQFTAEESARAYAVAERYAHERRAAGMPGPASVLHALLEAAEWWAHAMDLSEAWYANERRKALGGPLDS